MNIGVLYIGDLSGTSLHRANAFRRLGYNVTHISPRKFLPESILIDRVEWHVSPRLLTRFIGNKLTDIKNIDEISLVWVDSGSLVSLEVLEFFRKLGKKIVNFNHDDPYGKRDWIRFKEYRRAVPGYDLLIVVRAPNVEEAKKIGAKEVLLVTRTADEIAHAPRKINQEILQKWHSEVSFVGTWMPERGPFLVSLIERGVPLTIFGSGWHKAKEWGLLKKFHQKDHLDGDDYAYAIQCSKISLGLLSKGNRDLHTTRSLEIPMLGGLLCAERTNEHLAMYRDGYEAIFWSNPDECAKNCLALLTDEKKRNLIALAGQEKVLISGNTSEGLIKKVIGKLKL